MNKRKIIIAAAILMIIGVAMPNKAAAQKYQGQSVITGGVGFSVVGLFFGLVENALDATTNVNSTKTPVLLGAYDYGLSDRFSIGVGYTYQSLTIKYDGYYFNGSQDSLVTGNFTDRLTRQNFGIRPMFHFGDNDDLDIYAGLRISMVRWNYSSSRPDLGAGWASDLLGGASPVKAQALFGMRYFFTENIGFNTELAIGPSYFAMVGINARFGGN
jgi:hypothetical protein